MVAVVEADAAASGGVSLDVSAGGPAPLEAPASVPARTWDVLLEAGCSSEEPVGAITLYAQRDRERDRDCHGVEYGMGVLFCPI